MLINAYAIIIFSTVFDEAWNIYNPRPYPVKEYSLLQWEENDFYKNVRGEWILRQFRKTDSELKKAIRQEYWKEIRMYYNTNEESGKTLNNSRRKAETQEEIILDLFRRNPKFHMTPFDIQDAMHSLYEVNVPITSVRRAITDLTSEGWLIKTDIMKKGKYGKEVHCWKAKVQ